MNLREDAPKITVIMIGHRRADLLQRAVESLLRYTTRKDWELVLLLNGNAPSIEQFAVDLEKSARIPFLQVLRLEECRPGAARNHGIRVARGEILLFLDDDIEVFQDILSSALELFQDSALKVAGGANLTPPKSGALERATGQAMASFWGAASMRWRYRSRKHVQAVNEHALILCNLAIRKELFFLDLGVFPRHFVSNEENLFLQRLESLGAKMLATPALAVFHVRRSTWQGLAEQNFKYGKGRAQNCLFLPESFRSYYLLPSLFVFYCFLTALFFTTVPWSAWPLALYAAIALGFSAIDLWKSGDLAAFFFQPFCYFFIHCSYGLGFFSGILQWSWRRGKLCEA